MIKKISRIRAIGKFAEFEQTENFIYGEKGNNINIVYGLNGSGKTTLSNVLSFFGNESFIDKKEKAEIFDGLKDKENAEVELELQGGGKPKYPSDRDRSNNFYVFNQNFVSAHVFDGSRGNIKKFSNISASITNPEIDRINAAITTTNIELTGLLDEQRKIDGVNEATTKIRSAEFGKTLTDKGKRISTPKLKNINIPTDSVTDLEESISQLSQDYELSKRQNEIGVDINNLDSIAFITPPKYEFESLNSMLEKNIKQLSKESLQKKIDSVRDSFKDQGDKDKSENWFKFGQIVLKQRKSDAQKNCPLCESNITEEYADLLNDFDSYFDLEYERFVNGLSLQREEVDKLYKLVDQYQSNFSVLSAVQTKYLGRGEGLSPIDTDFPSVLSTIQSIRRLILAKQDNINNSYSIPGEIEDKLADLAESCEMYEKTRLSLLEYLGSKKLDTNKLEEEIRDAYKCIIFLEVDKSVKSGAVKKFNENALKISEIEETELPALSVELAKEIAKVKVESASISKYLDKMGVHNFVIEINENEKGENILIKYSDNGSTKGHLRNCLSEGEKTALAFAYFLSKYETK